MNKHFIQVPLFFLLLFMTNCLCAQGLNDYLKPDSNIKEYLLSYREVSDIHKSGDITPTSFSVLAEKGIIDYKGTIYDFNNTKYGSPYHSTLHMEIFVFNSRTSIDEFLKNGVNKTFDKFNHHIFFVNNALVGFTIFHQQTSRLEDIKIASSEYLKLLNRYMRRLNAKLLIPFEYSFNEKQYFEEWAKMLKNF